MKLSEIIENLDKKASIDSWVDAGEIRNEVGLEEWQDDPEDFQDRFKAYWIQKNLCTDTWVGIQAYFLDDVFVAASSQVYRKSGKNYSWVSDESFQSVFKYLSETSTSKQYSIINMDEDFGDGYTVEYASALLTDSGFYNGKDCTVIKRYGVNYEGSSDMWSKIDVKFEDGEVITIDVADFIIPYSLIDIAKKPM